MDSALMLTVPGLGYCAAGGLSLVRLEGPREWPVRARAALLYASVAVHAVLLGVRVFQSPMSPLSGVREAAVLVSLLLVVGYLMTARYLRGEGIAAVTLLVGGAALVAAAFTLPANPLPVPEVLRSPWLWLHVPLSLTGFLACALAGAAALMYLVVSTLLKKRRAIAILPNMPTLDSLERFSHRLAEIGFPLLTGGLISGMIWASSEWGSPLTSDPKQLMAIVTWLVYVVYFHVRSLRGMRGRKCALLLVLGAAAGIAGFVVAAMDAGQHSFL